MPADQARTAARRRFGNALRLREQCRDAWGWTWLDDLRTDLRFGLRGLARHPGFTATAALTLSIGSGCTAAMFSVTSAMLFRRFPVSVDPIAQGYAPEHARGFFRDVADEVAALPGVRSASFGHGRPSRRPSAPGT